MRLARWPARSHSSGGGAVCGNRRERTGCGGSEGGESGTVTPERRVPVRRRGCMSAAAKTAGEQRGRSFQRGQSGNPHGRSVGSRHRTTLALDALLEGEAERLTRKAVELALQGDITALKLCLDRLLPPRRDRPVLFALPPLDTPADAMKAMAALLQGVAIGEFT